MNKGKLLVIMACAWATVVAQRAHVDYDHQCNFSGYKTYHWVGLQEEQPLNQLMMERVVGFVEEALGSRRLKRVETNGDLTVRYRMTLTQQEQFTTNADMFGPSWGWGNAVFTTTANPVLLGTLVVDIVDVRRKQLVFQGVSTLTVSSKPDKNTKRLAKAVNEIFENYPPK